MSDQHLSALKGLFIIVLCSLSFLATGQKVCVLSDEVSQFYFSDEYIHWFRDTSKRVSPEEVLAGKYDGQFKERKAGMCAYFVKPDASYWAKIAIKHNAGDDKNYILEFPNQSIDQIHAFIPGPGGVKKVVFGDDLDFSERTFRHKNFELLLPQTGKKQVLYLKIDTDTSERFTVVVKSLKRFIDYSLSEYLLFGILYGLILLTIVVNSLMYHALKERQSIFYLLYALFFGMFFMVNNGTAYQYLWPGLAGWNEVSGAVFRFFVVVFAMLFMRDFLSTKSQFPLYDKIIKGWLLARTVFFIISLISPKLYSIRSIDMLPLILALVIGYQALQRGYRPARFFLLSYGFLFLASIVLALVYWGVLPMIPLTKYSLEICFSFDLIFLLMAVADKISIIRQDKERAHKKVIQSLEKNQRLKDKVNRELEAQVALRTIELNENNKLLQEANDKLKRQAEEINEMNLMLDMDNRTLKKEFHESLYARIMKSNVDFGEFKKVFPDKLACMKYLAEKKDEKGFLCPKCENTKYSEGTKKFSRRCTKCGYHESVTANTIFHGVRFPIEKAFYIFYLTVTKRNEMTIDNLSEVVDLRRNTCWSFKTKVVKAMEEHGKTESNDLAQNWEVIFNTDK